MGNSPEESGRNVIEGRSTRVVPAGGGFGFRASSDIVHPTGGELPGDRNPDDAAPIVGAITGGGILRVALGEGLAKLR